MQVERQADDEKAEPAKLEGHHARDDVGTDEAEEAADQIPHMPKTVAVGGDTQGKNRQADDQPNEFELEVGKQAVHGAQVRDWWGYVD